MPSFSNEDSDLSERGVESSRGPSGLLITGLIGLGMLAGIVFLAWLGSPRIEPAVGQKVNKLDLTPLVYADQAFTEQNLTGKVTVLHFWGTWCPPCREEFPGFAKVIQQFADNAEVQFVSVSSSQGPEYDLPQLAAKTRAFLEQYSAIVPTYADPAGLTRMEVALLMPDGSLPYPSTLVVDRQGAVAGVWIGFSPSGMKEVAKTVKSLL